MIKHHPDENLLAEYAAGTLDWALCMAVSAHLDFCPECKSHVNQMNSVGGVLLSTCNKAEINSQTFASLMNKIRTHEANCESVDLLQVKPVKPCAGVPKDPLMANLPKVISKLVPQKLKWSSVSPALKTARLQTGQNKYEVGFHRICTGGKAAEHGHRGLEVTLVLKGSFSDGDGVYSEGDFLVRQPGEVHQPTAAQNEDCLCFTIQEAPVSLTGFIGKLVNPFLSVKPG